MSTMLLGGLWHGAAWTFVVWGGLHGTYLIAERLLRERFAAWTPGPVALFGLGLLTYALVNLTWVFFRAKDFSTAWSVLCGMIGLNGDAKPILGTYFIVCVSTVVTLLVATHWYMRQRTLESVVARIPAAIIAMALGFMAFAIVISQGEGSAFIYFQF
jgi:alginate O-acetyltransferase complex protein AlgI